MFAVMWFGPHSVSVSAIYAVCVMGFFVFACRSWRKGEKGLAVYNGLWALIPLLVSALIPFSLGGAYKEVTPTVCQSADGLLHKYGLPEDAPRVYEAGNPNDSGYYCRWWKWRYVVFVDSFDRHVVKSRDCVFYHTDEAALLCDGRIVNFFSPVPTVTINTNVDAFWRRDHYGQPQGEFEMLVRSKDGSRRIEKWVFDG